MRNRLPIGFILLFSLIYIGFGDQFLPSSIGRYSFQARSSIDQVLVGMFPSWRPRTNPNARTQEAVRQTEGDEQKSN
ncbi:MAG: hypothetical protein HC780_05380 [Leptolyngbyaceae cyanobacterium CSU_1_3]|nr:hypothetical protein [Leptolyngbyaceae cyanobacterium CSU_1_3]